MTLFRELAILISLVFILVLGSVVWSDFRASSESLRGQMDTVARDMATTLGIALANSDRATDPAKIETFFNAVFDSGYLAEVELFDPDGVLLHAKRQAIEIRGVPDWFVALVPFEPATGQASIMQGWVQVGTLEVTLHPGYAYLGTYRSLKTVSIWVLTIAIVGLLVLWWCLHLVLRPLKLVRDQAEAIHENRFIHQTELPRTRELRRVVQAMNRMVDKVQSMLQEQSNTLNEYHELLYRDELTGFGNRRELLARLDDLHSDESTLRGHLAFIYINGLSTLSQRDGYADADAQLAALANTISESLRGESREFATRIRPTELAIYLDRDASDAKTVVDQWFESFKAETASLEIDELWLCCGLVQLRSGVDTSSALAESDFLLTRAKAVGAFAIVHESKTNANLPKGRMQWRSLLQHSLDEHSFYIVAQPVVRSDGTLDHREAFVRLRLAGEEIAAGLFMPMASALALDHEIDMEVLRLVLEGNNPASDDVLAINLSATVFSDVGAMSQLEQVLTKNAASGARRIQLEIRHFLLQQHEQSVDLVCSKLKELGYAIGIDNLDLSLPLERLQQLRPSYIKVNARVLADLAAEPGSAGLRALTTLTKGMDIKLIALGVDSEEVKNTVMGLGVDAIQGNHIAIAEELE